MAHDKGVILASMGFLVKYFVFPKIMNFLGRENLIYQRNLIGRKILFYLGH
jgi:hypothetical protein